MEEKLAESQQALEAEESKAKQEHRQRLKLESHIQDLDEKFDRESKVNFLKISNKRSALVVQSVDMNVSPPSLSSPLLLSPPSPTLILGLALGLGLG